MILFAQLNSPELTVGFLGIAALSCLGIWAAVRWLLRGPVRPDPWDEQIAAQIARDETTALCHRCLCPHDSSIDFCPECGAAVGQYTNWLPFPYLFSLGHTLRIGTTGEFRHSRLIICGFMLLGLAEYMMLAPVYWLMFFRNLSRQRQTELTGEKNGPEASSGVP